MKQSQKSGLPCIILIAFSQKLMKYDVLLKWQNLETEFKLDESALTSEIEIYNFDLICFDKNKHRGVVFCFIRKDLSSNSK